MGSFLFLVGYIHVSLVLKALPYAHGGVLG